MTKTSQYTYEDRLDVAAKSSMDSVRARTPTQQWLYDALPKEFHSSDAVLIAKQLNPSVSERTARAMLKDSSLFKKIAYARYRKLG